MGAALIVICIMLAAVGTAALFIVDNTSARDLDQETGRPPPLVPPQNLVSEVLLVAAGAATIALGMFVGH